MIDYIKNLKNNNSYLTKNDINPFLDIYFDIYAVESFYGKEIQKMNGITTTFSNNIIKITYDKKDSLLVLLFLWIRLDDSFFFQWVNFTINNHTFDKLSENHDETFKTLFPLIKNTNTIYITPKTKNDLTYAQNVIIYFGDSIHTADYRLAKELDRQELEEK